MDTQPLIDLLAKAAVALDNTRQAIESLTDVVEEAINVLYDRQEKADGKIDIQVSSRPPTSGERNMLIEYLAKRAGMDREYLQNISDEELLKEYYKTLTKTYTKRYRII